MAETPTSVTIPTQLIERWLSVSNTTYPNVRLTRADWDYLYVAFDKSVISQARLRDVVIKLSQGDAIEAASILEDHNKLLVESQNAWRQFFTAVMSSVETRETNV